MSKEKDPKEAGCLLLWSYREGRRKTSTKNGFVQDTGMRCGYDEEYMNIEAENTDVAVSYRNDVYLSVLHKVQFAIWQQEGLALYGT